MSNEKARFAPLEHVHVPDLWARAKDRTPTSDIEPSRRRSGGRLSAAITALVVSGAATVFLWQTMAPSGQAPSGDSRSGAEAHQTAASGYQTVASAIVLDPQGTMVFAPPQAGDSPKMSANDAIAAFESVDPDFQLPGDAQVFLGAYTASLPNGEYRFLDRLAWGITFKQCAQPHGFVSPSASMPCTRWIFLDANTGEMLEAAWQQGT